MKGNPSKHLIITSSGGGGHISAAKAKKEELIANGIPEENIDVVDIMGLDRALASNTSAWIPTIKGPFTGYEYFSGQANINRWDELMKLGGMYAIEKINQLKKFQPLAENIQYNSIYNNLKKYLETNDVIEIYDTQALSSAAMCKAVYEYNKKHKKNIGIIKTVTEYLTHKTDHFLVPVSAIDSKHNQVLTVQAAEPPFLGPKETLEEFKKKHKVQNIKFDFLSEKGIEPPVRKEFKEQDFNKTKEIIIKAKEKTSGRELQERDYISQILGDKAKNTNDDFIIKKGEDDKLITITLGSQGSKTVLSYIDSFIEQAIKVDNLKGNVYFCIAAGKNDGEASLYGMVRRQIRKKISFLERQGIEIPENIKIIPLAFQDGKHMASLHHNSDLLITRTGGLSSIETKYTQQKNPNRKVFLHSEQIIEDNYIYPTHNYDAVYEKLVTGALSWEAGNGEKLMADIGASFINTATIDYGLNGRIKIHHKDSLFYLAYNNQLDASNHDLIKRIIYEGSNPNLKLPDGSFIIDHAKDDLTKSLLISCGAKASSKVKSELGKGYKKYIENNKKNHFKELIKAIDEEDVHKVKGLLHNFPDLRSVNKLKELKNLSYEQYAIQHNKLEVLDILIRKNDNINKSNDFGTALHFAVKNKNLNAIELLLASGANPYVSYDGKNIIEQLENKKENTDKKLLKLLIKYGHINLDKDKIPNVHGVRLEKLYEIMYKQDNLYGNNELHRAVYFLNKGKDKFAKEFGDRNILEVLQDNIDNINIKNKAGLTPISLCQNQKIRRLLSDFGADLKYKPKGLNVNEKSELQKLSDNYKKTMSKAKEILAAQYKLYKSNSVGFVDSILGKVEYTLKSNGIELDAVNKELVKGYLKLSFERLKNARTEAEKMNIFEKIINFFRKIFGKDLMTKVMKEISKDFEYKINKNVKISHTQKIKEERKILKANKKGL